MTSLFRFSWILFCIVILGLVVTPSATQADPPNIIFVMADDLGYGDLGCYGQERIQTPAIDQMAAEGMKFTDFYAGSTVCAPSRCVLMTGKHMGHVSVRGNSKQNLRPDELTVAEVLNQAGYTCGMFGKWGLGHEGSSGIPTQKGFDEFVGYLDQHHAHNFYPTFLIRNGKRFSLNNVVPDEGEYGQGVATKKKEYSHDIIADAAMKFLDENHDKQFFLYLPITLPHANNEGGKKGMEIPSFGRYEDKDWADPEKGRAAMISRVDDDMAKLFAKLKEHGIDDETIVFFTSDNGPHAEGGSDPDFFDSNGPLRGIKRDLYEGGIRVPFIARWPGKVEAGTVSDHQGYFGDMMATFAALAETTIPDGHDSVSIVPTLLGNADEQMEHEYLYWEFHERGFKQAVRDGDWKYVRINNKHELYNLANDPGEEHNIAAEHPEILERLKKYADEAHVDNPDWPVEIRNS